MTVTDLIVWPALWFSTYVLSNSHCHKWGEQPLQPYNFNVWYPHICANQLSCFWLHNLHIVALCHASGTFILNIALHVLHTPIEPHQQICIFVMYNITWAHTLTLLPVHLWYFNGLLFEHHIHHAVKVTWPMQPSHALIVVLCLVLRGTTPNTSVVCVFIISRFNKSLRWHRLQMYKFCIHFHTIAPQPSMPLHVARPILGHEISYCWHMMGML